MSDLQIAASNLNPALGTSFKVTLTRYPDMEYFAQSIDFPGLTLDPISVNYRNHRGKIPDNEIVYEDFRVQFILDEGFYLYESAKEWMTLCTYTIVEENGLTKIKELFEDIDVFLTNSNKVATHIVKIRDAFPTSISGFHYSSNISAADVITVTIGFAYQTLVIEKMQ